MQIFKLKKGGETENVKETIIVLKKPVDEELLKTAINIVAKRNPTDVYEFIEFLKTQFDCIYGYDVLDDVETFYY